MSSKGSRRTSRNRRTNIKDWSKCSCRSPNVVAFEQEFICRHSEIMNENNRGPLSTAIRTGDIEDSFVGSLDDDPGLEVVARQWWSHSWLEMAARYGRIEIAEVLGFNGI